MFNYIKNLISQPINISMFIILSVLSMQIILFSSCNKPLRLSEKNEKIKVPNIFTDNMVLQREIKIPIWGWASPKNKIIIKYGDNTWNGQADKQGFWKIYIGPLYPGNQNDLTIKSIDDIVILKNVVVGDVWICSGQSNMEMQVNGFLKVNNADKETEEANYPLIRLITIPHKISYEIQDNFEGNGWMICNPKNIKDFSAVAYFFGRELHNKLNIPIGLINTSFGGSPIEAWSSIDCLEKHKKYKKLREEMNYKSKNIKILEAEFPSKLEKWEKSAEDKDIGMKNQKELWSDPVMNITNWKTMNLPKVWESAGLEDFDGMVWFRKDIEIPESWLGKKLTLSLGPIDDRDKTFFNGHFLGGMNEWHQYRIYEISDKFVNTKNVSVVVRVLDTGGAGGLYGKPEDMKLFLKDNPSEYIDLSGDWKYKISYDLKDIGIRPVQPVYHGDPSVLFNGMINPLINYGIKGFIWYQGESNANNAYEYRHLFPDMIKDWRKKWKQGDIPFLFVQLANWLPVKEKPEDDLWAELREAQLMTLSEPNTGMAVAIDIGDAEDIHPKNKLEVGRRLSLAALKIAYRQDILFSGPIYKKDTIKITGNKIKINFDYIGSGLKTSDGGKIKGFSIAGKDKIFKWADASIEGDSVIIWNNEISDPVAIRYAWASNPVCNLYNKEGLPASPFRTDRWKGLTEK